MNQKTFHTILQEITPELIKKSEILKSLNFKQWRERDTQEIGFESPYTPIDVTDPYYAPRVKEYKAEYPGTTDFRSGLSLIMFKKLRNNHKHGSDKQKAGSVLQLSRHLSFTRPNENWETGFKCKSFTIKFNRGIVTIDDETGERYTLDLTDVTESDLQSGNDPLTPRLISIIETCFISRTALESN